MNIQRLLEAAMPEWEPVREIGAGTQGIVYMIKTRESQYYGEMYSALKVIKLSRIEVETKSYLRKAALMQQLSNHPNFVHMQDWKVVRDPDTEEIFFMIRMELLLPLDRYEGFDVRKIGLDICNALSVLHKNNHYHLNIKPGNIFVDEKENFKLGDYYSDRDIETIQKGDFPIGTLHYADPDILCQRIPPTDIITAKSADIYSLGAVLLELEMWNSFGRDWHGPDDDPYERESWFLMYIRENRLQPYSGFSLYRFISGAMSHRYKFDSAEKIKNDIFCVTELSLCNRKTEISSKISFRYFIHDDARQELILKYDSGIEYMKKGSPYEIFVGEPIGIRLTYIGHEKPLSILINGIQVPFDAGNGFIDLSFQDIFQGEIIPEKMQIEAIYRNSEIFVWKLNKGHPKRHWEWGKNPDWT